jgi:hypothetical protein
MVWGLPLAEQASAQALVRRRGRDSPQCSSLRYNMHHDVKKEKLIVFIIGRKKSNSSTSMTPELWEVQWA